MDPSALSQRKRIHRSRASVGASPVLREEHLRDTLSGRVTLRRTFGTCAIIGALLLADAPSYSSHPGEGQQANAALAIAGVVLMAPWLLYLVGLIPRRARQRRRDDLPHLHTAVWRRWQWLIVCTCLFGAAGLVRAPVHLTAPLALTTLGLATALIWRTLILSLALARQRQSRSAARLGWLALAPCSLAAMLGAFLLAGDSWITLLLGCVCSCAGPVAAAGILRAHTWHRA